MALADDDQGLMLLGAVLGLVLIPPCMLWRHKVFKSRCVSFGPAPPGILGTPQAVPFCR